MKSDAAVVVSCDNERCSEDKEVTLCATARGGWDERYVDDELVESGWIVVSDDIHYCCQECADEAAQ